MTQRQNVTRYEEDFVAWLEDQARHARRGEIGALDLENIAEELDGMARSDRREIRNRLIMLLAHLLKCLVQPHKRSSSWLGTIDEQRFQIAELLEDSPSFHNYPAQILDRYYPFCTTRCGTPNAAIRKRPPEKLPFRHCGGTRPRVASSRAGPI
jgi:hypothetical protein